MGMMPGIAKMKNQMADAGLDDKLLKRQIAIIDSMTPKERRNPDFSKQAARSASPPAPAPRPEEINKLLKMHRGMADMMKAMGGKAGKRGPLAGLAQMMGFGGGMPTPEQMAEARQEDAGRHAWRGRARSAARHAAAAEACRRTSRACPVSAAENSPDCRACPASERRNEPFNRSSDHRTERNCKCLSSSAWPAPAPRSGRSITSSLADSRSPRDGRFIERLGYFNPLLPKDKEERLKLDLDKVKAWMNKGAQPSDRVMRFLDAAGIAKREKRNNPEKAVPRKERKASAEEAAKAKAAALPRKAAAAAAAGGKRSAKVAASRRARRAEPHSSRRVAAL